MEELKYRRSVAGQLIISILLFSSVITILMTSFQLYTDYSKDVKGVEIQIHNIVQSSLQSLSSSLWDLYRSQLETQLEGLVQMPDIRYLGVQSKKKLFASKGTLPLNNFIDVSFPMVHVSGNKSTQIGILRVVASLDGVYQRLYDKVLIIFVSNAVKTLLVSIFIFFIFQFFVTRHLTTIVQHLRDFSPNHFDHTLSLKRQARYDELQQVADAVNALMTNLAKTTISKDYVDLIIENMKDILIVFDTDGNISLSNRYTSEILGYSGEELIGKHIQDFIPSLEYGVLSKKIINQEITIVQKWRENVTALVSSSPLKDHRKKVIGHICIAKDITDLKNFKEKLEKHAQLAHAGRLSSLGEMATGIAHEINQPLAIISLANQVLKIYFTKHDEAQFEGESVLSIEEQINRVSTIIANMRTFARSEDNSVRSIDITEPLNNALSFFREQFRLHEIDLHISITKELPSVRINPQKFEQIIVNLLSNARYAVEKRADQAEGNFTKTINVRLSSNPGRTQTILEIEDNGIGMTNEIKARCLEPFYTNKGVGQGTGLGLSIVHNIVTDFKGKIKVERGERSGAIFRIFIPTGDVEKYQTEP